ncbi:hypothetical protein J2T09_002759 [Neorhizobium huautlense]|uniref:Uncharacterized protein n=1 Tax=Neorhizobium huautlense TaxID=67774 RepID=A0ABT9PW97_9HYPH|nr:hypothetical protein [Neorhizobium huautlense]
MSGAFLCFVLSGPRENAGDNDVKTLGKDVDSRPRLTFF